MAVALLPCRLCGRMPIASGFQATSETRPGKVGWTKIVCVGHPYVKVRVTAELHDEAAEVWNGIMGPIERNQ